MPKKQSVTPWEVSGDIDYDRLIKEFGVEKIDESLRKKLKKAHPLLRRGSYFAHRDFNLWIKDAEAKKRVSVLTGRGPSESLHIGHLVPYLVAKSLQDLYNCEVIIPISEDEKFFVKNNLSFEDVRKFGRDNILDLIALGFKPGKTFFTLDFSDTQLYNYSAKIAKLITYSEARAVFGLKPENNIGWSFYPAVQAYHILMPQFLHGRHRTVVPVGIDQDPFIRLTRDVAEHNSLKLIKPGGIYSKFIPGLKGSAKMSASEKEQTNLIFLKDTPNEVKKKINKYAFSGGRDTLEEHKKYGGNPDVDVAYQYLHTLFEEDDAKLKQLHDEYKSGTLTTGELKAYTIEKINAFLSNHQKARKAAEKQIDKFIYKN